MDDKKITIYDLMENQLKDDARSIKFIKDLGKKLISKIKMINEEMENVKLKGFNNLNQDEKMELGNLHELKIKYQAQFDMIKVILNKSDELIDEWMIKKYKEKGLDDKFFINIDK